MQEKSIKEPQQLHFSANGTITHGADQAWYKDLWQIRAGCGPTACSHLIWYLAKTRNANKTLCTYEGNSKESILSLMEDVWSYVTPRRMGVNSTTILSNGALSYAKDRNNELCARVLEVPLIKSSRPCFGEVSDFISTALDKDLPVAFLNLSNGSLKNLDRWHWVTIVGTEKGGVRMYDQCESKLIDIRQWLDTTTFGGGLVYIEPK